MQLEMKYNAREMARKRHIQEELARLMGKKGVVPE